MDTVNTVNTAEKAPGRDPGKKKSLLIHGAILAVGVAAVWYYPPNFVWWNIGYALYFVAWAVGRILRDRPRGWRKVLDALLLSFAFVPVFLLMLIPGWFVGVAHSFYHPDYARDLAEYRVGQKEPPLRRAAYYRNYNIWAYEGDISKKDLEKLAACRNWELKPIAKPPAEIWSWGSAPGLIAAHEARKRGEEYADRILVTIEKGLSRSTFSPKSKGGEFVVWDAASTRLYVWRSMR